MMLAFDLDHWVIMLALTRWDIQRKTRLEVSRGQNEFEILVGYSIKEMVKFIP